MGSKANVVLVHGAWADGSSWSKVIPLLQQKEFNVTAAQIPLTSFPPRSYFSLFIASRSPRNTEVFL